jgi:hypothetical protein
MYTIMSSAFWTGIFDENLYFVRLVYVWNMYIYFSIYMNVNIYVPKYIYSHVYMNIILKYIFFDADIYVYEPFLDQDFL